VKSCHHNDLPILTKILLEMNDIELEPNVKLNGLMVFDFFMRVAFEETDTITAKMFGKDVEVNKFSIHTINFN